MNLHHIRLLGTLLPLALATLVACGDGRHIEGLGEDTADPGHAGSVGSGSGDRTKRDAEGLTLGTPWSDGFDVQVDGLSWTGDQGIEVFVGVSDETTGEPVRGFNADHFTFQEDGVDLGPEVLFDVRREQALQVAIVLDLSASIREAGATEAVKDAARALVQGLPTGTRFALIRFSTGHDLVLPFTTDAQAVLDAIETLGAMDGRDGRFTNLWGALERAASVLGDASETGREGRAVVAFTDGRDNVAESDPQKVRQALGQHGALVYAVGLGEQVDADALRTLAGDARFITAMDPSDLEPVFNDIATRLGELLRVTWYSPKFSGRHTLSVTVGRDGKRAGFDIVFEL